MVEKKKRIESDPGVMMWWKEASKGLREALVGLRELPKASTLLHRLAAIQNMYEYFYKWFEIEAEFRGFRFTFGTEAQGDDRQVTHPRQYTVITPREARHSPGTVIQLSGQLDGPFNFPRKPNADDYPGLLEFHKNFGRGHVIESSALWVAAAQKPANSVL